jgi:hypothetical protein
MEVVGEKRSRQEDILEAVERHMQPKKPLIQFEQEKPKHDTEQETPKPETEQETPKPETEQETSEPEESDTEEQEPSEQEQQRIKIYRNTVPEKSAEAQLEYIRSRFIGDADRDIDLVEWGLISINETRTLSIPNEKSVDSGELRFTLQELRLEWVFRLGRCETHSEVSRFEFEFNPEALLRVLFGKQWSQHHIKPSKLCFFGTRDFCEMLPDDNPPENLVGKLLLFPPPAGNAEGGDVHFPDIYRMASPLNHYVDGSRAEAPRSETIMPYIYFRSDLKCAIDPLTDGARFVLVYDVLSGSGAPSAAAFDKSSIKARKWPEDDDLQIAAELHKQFGDKPNVYVDDGSFSGGTINALAELFPYKWVVSEAGLDRPNTVYYDIDDLYVTPRMSFAKIITHKTKAYTVQHYLAGPEYAASQHIKLPYIPERPAMKPLHRGVLLNPRGGTRVKRYTAPDGL